MKKLKTKKGLSKRVKLTSSGKIKRYKSGKSHLLRKKSAKRKRKLRKAGLVTSKGSRKNIKKLLPYK